MDNMLLTNDWGNGFVSSNKNYFKNPYGASDIPKHDGGSGCNN